MMITMRLFLAMAMLVTTVAGCGAEDEGAALDVGTTGQTAGVRRDRDRDWSAAPAGGLSVGGARRGEMAKSGGGVSVGAGATGRSACTCEEAHRTFSTTTCGEGPCRQHEQGICLAGAPDRAHQRLRDEGLRGRQHDRN
jgi:hypothetical protein